MTYTIKLRDGKYTVINESPYGLRFLRYDEAWPAGDDLKWSNVVIAMAERVEELECAVKAVLDGELDAPDGCVMHGFQQLKHYPETVLVLAPRWEARLRNVLEQKP